MGGCFLKGSFCPFRISNKSWNQPNHKRDGLVHEGTINWLCKIRGGRGWTFDKHTRHWYLEWHYMYEHVEWGCFTRGIVDSMEVAHVEKKEFELLLAWP